MKAKRFITGILVALIISCPALAAPTYRWVFDQSTYQVAPGATQDVFVYLEEVVTGGDTAILDSTAGAGLGSIGLQLRCSDPPQPTDPARVINDSDITPNGAFDYLDTATAYSDRAELNQLILLNNAVYGTESPTNTFRVLAGAFTVTAGSVIGEQTPLRVTDLDAGQDDTVDSTGSITLDALITDGSATFEVVPEPSGIILALLGVFGVGIFLIGRNRRSN